MIVQKAFKIRLYPTKGQQVFFNKTFGCCRIIYNEMLGLKQTFYKNYDFTKVKDTQLLTFIKNEYWFMKEADSQGLCNTFMDCMKAYKSFFKGQTKFPKFKDKKSKQSYRNAMCQKKLNKLIQCNKILLPTVGLVSFRQDYDFSKLNITKIYNVTVERSKTNKYYCSIACDVDIKEYEHTGEVIGIDLGVKDLVIDSNVNKYNNPKLLYKTEKIIKKLQKQYSKKTKGSKNQKKAKLKLATAHEKLSNKRKDNLHKLTTKLIKENSVICIENLNIKGMTKNHKLAKAIQDCSFGTLVNMLKYKAAWHNRQIIEVGRYYPSSKTCSCCEYRMKKMSLDVREWTCPNCRAFHDRDINAAKNILNEGLRILDSVGQELPDFKLVENPTMDDKNSVRCSLKSSGSMKQENQLSLAVD